MGCETEQDHRGRDRSLQVTNLQEPSDDKHQRLTGSDQTTVSDLRLVIGDL